MSDCHPECTIGPNADHPGSSSYRCQDKNGISLPFPGEKFTASDLGRGYVIYTFDRDHEGHAEDGYWCNYCETMTEHMSSGHPEPKPRMVDPNTLALNIMAAKVARVREFAEGIIAYEDEHAEGPDTPLRLAFARDMLAILDES